LNRRSIRFKPPTGSCKLSRGTFRVRKLNRCGIIRFRTQCHPNVMVCKKQQQLLRSGKTGLKRPLNKGNSRVRTLNRRGSIRFKASKPHVQSDRAHSHFPCGKSEVLEVCKSGNVKDYTRYIQAVTLHHHQNEWSQKVAESKEVLLRNNYGISAIRHELSGALHPTGTQNQTQSQVARTSGSNGVEDLVGSQQPRSVLTAGVVDKGVKSDTPTSGDK